MPVFLIRKEKIVRMSFLVLLELRRLLSIAKYVFSSVACMIFKFYSWITVIVAVSIPMPILPIESALKLEAFLKVLAVFWDCLILKLLFRLEMLEKT